MLLLSDNYPLPFLISYGSGCVQIHEFFQTANAEDISEDEEQRSNLVGLEYNIPLPHQGFPLLLLG